MLHLLPFEEVAVILNLSKVALFILLPVPKLLKMWVELFSNVAESSPRVDPWNEYTGLSKCCCSVKINNIISLQNLYLFKIKWIVKTREKKTKKNKCKWYPHWQNWVITPHTRKCRLFYNSTKNSNVCL